MKQLKTQPCVICGGEMTWETREETLCYKDHEKKIQTEGWWCSSCGEGIVSGDALLQSEREFLSLKAEVDGVLSPNEVAAIRQRLGLSQRKAGELLGGGPRAFQKYEAGRQAVSVPMSNLLRLLANEPKRLKELTPNTTTKETKPGPRAPRRATRKKS